MCFRQDGGPIYEQIDEAYQFVLRNIRMGAEFGGLTIEEMRKGYSRPRNKGIVSALAYMKVVERWGSGIPRLYENCERAGLREPEFSERAGCFRVNMFRNMGLTQMKPENAVSVNDLFEQEKNRKKNRKGNRKGGVV